MPGRDRDSGDASSARAPRVVALITGALVALTMAVTGVFAPLHDAANSGTSGAESGEAAAPFAALRHDSRVTGPGADEVDLQIADTATLGSTSRCDHASPYLDDQTVDPLVVDDFQPGESTTGFVCVRNAGSEPAAIGVEVFNTANVETGCTNDEPAVDPDGPDCGTTGELGRHLALAVGAAGVNETGRCDATSGGPVSSTGIQDSGARPVGPVIPAGEYACYRTLVSYPDVDHDARAEAQTDRVSWQLRFGGTASALPDLLLDKALVDHTGNRAEWRLRVTNDGPGPVAGPITVVDELPAGLTFVSGSGGGFDCTASGQTVTCTRATWLDEGDSAAVRIVTEIADGATGDLVNRAEVRASGAAPATANDADTAVLAMGEEAGGGGGGGGAGSGGSGGGGTGSGSGGSLAFTGAEVMLTVAVGLALVAVGVVLVAASRRRRARAAVEG